MISQQTARACLKYLADGRNLPPNAEYLARGEVSNAGIDSASDWKKDYVQLQVLESRARQAILRLAKLVEKGTPWKDLNMDCVAVSRAHIEVFLLRTFINTISIAEQSLRPILLKLQNLVYSRIPRYNFNISLPCTFLSRRWANY